MVEAKIAELTSAAQREEEQEQRIASASRAQAADLHRQIDAMPGTEQDRLAALQASYVQLLQTQKRLEAENGALKARHEASLRDLEARLAKATAGKAKLEALCRELQRQSRAVEAESKRVAEEEGARRAQLSQSFHKTIGEVTAKLEEQAEERARQAKESEALRGKLDSFAEQYELREKHFAMLTKAKELERQLLEAKLK
jgi:hypothetical protein